MRGAFEAPCNVQALRLIRMCTLHEDLAKNSHLGRIRSLSQQRTFKIRPCCRETVRCDLTNLGAGCHPFHPSFQKARTKDAIYCRTVPFGWIYRTRNPSALHPLRPKELSGEPKSVERVANKQSNQAKRTDRANVSTSSPASYANVIVRFSPPFTATASANGNTRHWFGHVIARWPGTSIAITF